MPQHGTRKCGDALIWNSELATCVLHYWGDIGIMHMADARKKMVLHLVIEAAHIPIKHEVVRCKIGGGAQLVNYPAIAHLAIGIWQRIVANLHDVGRLKDHAEYNATDEMHEEEASQRHIPRNWQQHYRQNKCDDEISGLEQQHSGYDDAKTLGIAVGHAAVSVVNELFEIFHEHPTDGHQAVEEPSVNVLEAMHSPAFCKWGKA